VPNRTYPEKNMAPMDAKDIYGFSAKDIDGNEVSMEKYRGKVVLVVNVATRWTLTSTNYAELQELHQQYAPNLAILAFPSNLHIFNQESGTDEQIKKFAREEKKAGFDLFSKSEITGKAAIPLYQYLTCALKGFMTDGIKTNFTKFLINKQGVPFKRYSPTTAPRKIEPDIQKLLDQ